MLTVALCAQVGISIVDQGIPTLAGFLKDDLGLSAATVGLAVSAFPFGKIFGSYLAGRTADRIGERPVLLAGGILTAAAVALAAASPLLALFPLLVVAGFAASSATPAGGRLVLHAFPPARHGFVLGIRQTGIPVGGLLAAVLLPWIAHSSGWRTSFAAAAGVTALAVTPLLLSRIGDGASLASESGEELVDHGIGREVKLLTAWGCLLVTGQYALLAFLALDLHRSAGLSLPRASLLLAVANAAGIAGRVGWGALSDRLLGRGRKPLLLLLNAMGIAGALLLFAVSRSAPTVVLGLVAALAGLSLIGFQGLWVTMISEAAGPARVGAATGFGITFVTIAIASTPPLLGLVADLAGTYRAVWAVLAVLVSLALVPALLLREGQAPAAT